jgi:hypothetical protein
MDWVQRLSTLQVQLEQAVTADDFELIATLGMQLKALQQQSAQLPLSEEDYLTLPARHADLVWQVTEKCKELVLAEEYSAVTVLGAKLSELRAAVLPVIVGDNASCQVSGTIGCSMSRSALTLRPRGLVLDGIHPGVNEEESADCSANLQGLTDQCAALKRLVAFVPQRSDIIQRQQSVRHQFETALEAAVDFVLVGTLGAELKALQQQAAQLPLSEEDYLTLPGRHADLVRRVTDTCRELMRARDYAALGPLSAKLKELRALDLTGIPGTGHESDGELDPVVVSGPVVRDDEGENDPVIATPTRHG